MNSTKSSRNSGKKVIKQINLTAIALIFIGFIVKCESSGEYRVVETENGFVRGIRKTTLLKGIDYYSFKGIPFAKSPTGELRFKPPKPVDSWGPMVIDAFEHGPICIQPVVPFFDNSQPQSEDCLFLNVYVPAAKCNKKYAVMVFIYGGGYAVESGNDNFYGPDFLIEQGVILVTLNYRVGVLGFLSLDTPEYSGNMGLKDQQLAMKWVHSNIEHFWGDNQRITLFGESVGSICTHFHILSKKSRKYFRNAILMSGTVDIVWALALNGKPDHLSAAFKIAADLGEPKQTFDELVSFLRTAPASTFAKYGTTFTRVFDISMAPIIERKDAIHPFIVEPPHKIYDHTKIKVDALFSFCSIEFLFFYTYSEGETHDLEGFNRNFSLPLPFRGVELSFDSPEYQQIAQELRAFYFGNAPVDEKTLKQYLDLLSDANFAYPIGKSARRHARKSAAKSYYLRFSVNSKLSLIEREKIALQGPLAAHTDDICYVFRCGNSQKIYDEILSNKNDEQSKVSLRTIKNMSKLYANFAKHGKPTHKGRPVAEFRPIEKCHVNFVDVTNDGLIPGQNPNQAAYDLWARIEQQARQTNYPPKYHRIDECSSITVK